MSRKLQDRLALASYKAKNGLDSMSFSMVEAQFESSASRDRTSSIVSSGSSTPSDGSDSLPYSRPFHSSPVTARIYSDILSSQGRSEIPRKRARFERQYTAPTPISSVKRSRKQGEPQSSPIRKHKPVLSASSPLESRYPAEFNTAEAPHFSFVSSASTISDSPPFDPSSHDTFELPAAFHGSPPRTPPPSRPRGLKARKTDMSHGEEGADLLLYLATSPSPARAMKGAPRTLAPSTPPMNHATLPSSMINTPGGSHNLLGFSTPAQNFNFAEFCNVTPSPAQAAFSRTPGPSKTPLAASEARRRLNFDSLLPPSGSPNLSRTGHETGLGMDLGGELKA